MWSIYWLIKNWSSFSDKFYFEFSPKIESSVFGFLKIFFRVNDPRKKRTFSLLVGWVGGGWVCGVCQGQVVRAHC